MQKETRLLSNLIHRLSGTPRAGRTDPLSVFQEFGRSVERSCAGRPGRASASSGLAARARQKGRRP